MTFLEFFAGSGMVRLGLGPNWECLLANDIDPKKGAAYAANFGRDHLRVCDVANLTTAYLPGRADLAWASPPCQDVSEAGPRVGLSGKRSGAFWPFWRLIEELNAEGRAPRTIVLENVTGLLQSHGGADIAAIREAFEAQGYRHATAIIDAKHFVPQSRPRIFVVGSRDVDPAPLVDEAMKALPIRNADLVDYLDIDARAGAFSPTEVARHLEMMAPEQRARVDAARASGHPFAAPFARRMRGPVSGERVQRVEARFDGLANALRVAGTGGSSKQFVMIIRGDETRMRAILPREAARLMGMPDSYALPSNATEALSLAGDGVVIPVVRHLAEYVIEPALRASSFAPFWRAEQENKVMTNTHPLFVGEELRDQCLHDAATIVVAFVFDCEFKDCRFNNDGTPWPTSVTHIEIGYPEKWSNEEALTAIASIHEAGAMAVAKQHGRGPHIINNEWRACKLLNDPAIWKAIEALAEFIEEEDGALGTDGPDGESMALEMLKSMNLPSFEFV